MPRYEFQMTPSDGLMELYAVISIVFWNIRSLNDLSNKFTSKNAAEITSRSDTCSLAGVCWIYRCTGGRTGHYRTC